MKAGACDSLNAPRHITNILALFIQLYVALAAPFNSGISILAPNGTEAARLTNPAGSPIFPYDSPANVAFSKQGSLVVTNHAFATAIPANFTVLDVFVDDKEFPLVRPNVE